MSESISKKSKLFDNTITLLVSFVVLVVIGVSLAYLILHINQSRTFRGAIVANGKECAQIGRSIFNKNGNVIDVAIAVLLCEGIAMPQSTGLGGGFVLVFYKRSTKVVRTLNARERAPIRSFVDMFNGSDQLSSRGPLSIAVPGELLGYWELHNEYGSLPWPDLIQPSIDLAKSGHFVTTLLEKILKQKRDSILANEGMKEIFIDPTTNDTWKHGQLIKRPVLAKTLEVISREGANALYNGSLTDKFIKELQDLGSIITKEDLTTFKVEWQDPITTTLKDNSTLYTSNSPTSGPLLVFILNILDGFLKGPKLNTIFNWHRIIESFKFAYGARTMLGDSASKEIRETINNISSKVYAASIRDKIHDNRTVNDPEYYNGNFMDANDFGTAHVSIIAPNGDAVSVTGTINLYFGSMIRSRTTGIILNDEMDDFSAPNVTNYFGIKPSSTNLISPRKRPLSSMCPVIIIDGNGDTRLVVGGAGGSKITSATALGIMRHLWFNDSIQKAVASKRLHHQLYPMEIQVEYEFDKETVKALKRFNHSVYQESPSDGFAAIIGLTNQSGVIDGALDPRRIGSLIL